jgi:hypothetical protein
MCRKWARKQLAREMRRCRSPWRAVADLIAAAKASEYKGKFRLYQWLAPRVAALAAVASFLAAAIKDFVCIRITLTTPRSPLRGRRGENRSLAGAPVQRTHTSA